MNALSTASIATSAECAIFLQVLRATGFNCSIRDGGLRVGPREKIGEFERWAIKEHKDGLLELLAAEEASAALLGKYHREMRDFDARPAKFRPKQEITEVGQALLAHDVLLDVSAEVAA